MKLRSPIQELNMIASALVETMINEIKSKVGTEATGMKKIVQNLEILILIPIKVIKKGKIEIKVRSHRDFKKSSKHNENKNSENSRKNSNTVKINPDLLPPSIFNKAQANYSNQNSMEQNEIRKLSRVEMLELGRK